MAASPSRTLFLPFMLACFTYGALAADRTLGTVAGNCKDMFATTIQQHYATDKECADLIRTAMSTPGGDQCPGGQADVGTPVHKCMTKNDQVSRLVPQLAAAMGEDGVLGCCGPFTSSINSCG